jgi:outer membrane immunogenic protein
MKKVLLSGVAAAVLVAAPALAADLPVRAPAPVYKAPAVIAPMVYNWSGFYIGGNAGYGWENTRTDYSYTSLPAGSVTRGFDDVFGPTGSDLTGGNAGPLNVGGSSAVASAIASGFLPTSIGKKNQGFFTGGVQGGFNYQVNQLVFGGEADFMWMNGVKTASYTAPNNGIISNTAVAQAGLQWLSTVRARAGFAVDRTLVYATGGVAFGRVVANTNGSGSDGSNTDLFSGSGTKTRTGYTVGGGLEYAFTPNWIARAEYLYYNLGTVNYAVAAANSVAAGEGLFINASQKMDGSIVRAAVSYKFGG